MIRKACRDDLPALRDIYNEAIAHTTATFDTEEKSMSDREDWFHAHTGKHILLVWEEEGTVCGYSSLSVYRERKAFDRTVEISVYIHPAHRGRGIGTALMRETISRAKESEEIDTVISLVTGSNAVSNRIHEQLGFSFCGCLHSVGEKFGQTLDLNAYELNVRS